MITWGKPNERYYEHGLDRGVLYLPNEAPIPWNGLTSFDESNSAGSSAMYYRDGVVYLADADASDFSAAMTALFWPDKFGECLGIPEATDGMFIDNQKPKQFGLCYRSLVGQGGGSDRFGYQLHLVYKAMASIGSRQRKTLGKDAEPIEFSFDIVCTPVKLIGYRPTAHYVIDTRGMAPSKIKQIEDLLYGVGSTPGRLPEPVELFDMLNYGDAMIFNVHTDGTYTVVGSADNLFEIDADHFQMMNTNGVANADGTYVISDGGHTDVILE